MNKDEIISIIKEEIYEERMEGDGHDGDAEDCESCKTLTSIRNRLIKRIEEEK